MQIRNIAIIAHVDHGKTTLVDKLLQQTNSIDTRKAPVTCVMDSNDLERERGITILAKNTAINWKGVKINVVDTPGHADFGGEVERILSMVDAVVLLVDAQEGPMPQTRFVTQKAFEAGLNPIVVVNKIDKQSARPDWVINEVFDLFDNLGANEIQLDFPIAYASAIEGYATDDPNKRTENMHSLLDMLLKHTPEPDCKIDGPLQLQISSLDYSSYVGTIGIGLIKRGELKPNTPVTIVDRDGKQRNGRVLQIHGFEGLERIELEHASAGDIVAISGIEPLNISDTICTPGEVEALPALTVDEPTIQMTFQVNTSPFSGKSGKFLTSRQISARLAKECLHNVALRVEQGSDADKFMVSGRGELHLSILIETMRREGYELAVSRPQVIIIEKDGQKCEPYEQLSIDVPSEHQGKVMEELAGRGGQIESMNPDDTGRIRLDYIIPSRGLIGFHSLFNTLTSGMGIATHAYDHYGPYMNKVFAERNRGVLISNQTGKASGYALWMLQARGKLFIPPQTPVYEGMVVGLHTRANDLVVNVTKEKQLTNVRASGTDENISLTPHQQFTLEQALEFIDEDELVEITPTDIRIRKKLLKEHERKRASREG
jgi:GTP-binding protein